METQQTKYMRGWLSTLIFISVVVMSSIKAKPTSLSPADPNIGPLHGSPVVNNDKPQGALEPRLNDGTWHAAARLPGSLETGGNGNSRYNIRRDGSLSLELNAPPSLFDQQNPSFSHDWIRNDRKITPTEVRSFSVVLSDVDVVGRYPDGESDSFSEAGVTGYQVHSSTINRMNASWKLNPRRSRISPEELLQYLTYFSQEHSRNYKVDKSLKDRRKSKSVTQPKANRDDVANFEKFTTWSDSDSDHDAEENEDSESAASASASKKTKLLFFNETDVDNIAGENNGTTDHIVLHDLIGTLEKLIETTTILRSENSTFAHRPEHEYEHHQHQHEFKNGSRTRMSATDPQQTASDLKKLMSLLLKSTDEGQKELNANGAQVVNVVITPNTNTGSNSTRQDERQKIIFLKNPQVKHLLDAALSDPTISFAAQKIAAALHTSPYSDKESEDFEGEIASASQSQITSMTPNSNQNQALGIPDGFPLNASGFLNLQHPNLQFHQALHQLVSNGSVPSGINASTKTNVINIFVLNFNSQSGVCSNDNHESNAVPVRLKAPVIYSLANDQKKPDILASSNGVRPSDLHTTPPLIFFNKLGLPIREQNINVNIKDEKQQIDDSIYASSSLFKPFIDVTSSHGDPYVAVTHDPPIVLSLPITTTTATSVETTSGKINILDLLPGSLSSFTKVDYEIGNDKYPPLELLPKISIPNAKINYTQSVNYTKEKLENDAAELLSYFTNPDYSVNPIDGGKPALPAEFYPLSWILNQEPPPKPFIKKPNAKLSKLDLEDPPYPEDSSSYEYADESREQSQSAPSIDKRVGLPMFDDSTTTMKYKAKTTTKPSNEDNRPLLYEQMLSNTRNSTKSLDFRKNKTKKGVNINGSSGSSNGSGNKYPPGREPVKSNSNSTNHSVPLSVQQNQSGASENIKNRLRNMITALGYSSIPTLAAGAVATWPYWVPIVASAGRQNRNQKRRRRDINLETLTFDNRNLSLTHPIAEPKSIIEHKEHNTLVQQGKEHFQVQNQILNQLSRSQWENSNSNSNLSTHSSSIQLDFRKETGTSSTTRDYLKAEEQIESDAKWIKVEVITESSPTFFKEPSAVNANANYAAAVTTGLTGSVKNQITNTSRREQDDNNRQFVNGEPQDVPLLKNFLKNILSNEWNISTTTSSHSPATPPPLLLSLSPMHLQSQQQIIQTIQKQQQVNMVPFIPIQNNEHVNNLKLKESQSHTKTQTQQSSSSSAAPLMSSVKTKTYLTDGRTADSFTSSRQRNNRRLHKIEDVPNLNLDMNDDLTHDMGTEDESPLVQSLTAMASSLTEQQSAENSSEKDVILSDDNSQSDQDTEPSDVEQELEHSDELEKGTDEEVHPQIQSPTSESKTLSTSYSAVWPDDSNKSNVNNNIPTGRSSTTPKGLTTWSQVNGGGSQPMDQPDESVGFKGTVQRVPSDHLVSGMLAFPLKSFLQFSTSSTVKPSSTIPIIVTRESPSESFSTTEIPRTTKSNAVMSLRKKPAPIQTIQSINRLKHKKPNPSKYVKSPPENLIATAISSDDTQTTYQLKSVPEIKSSSSETPTKYTRRPGYPWPINPTTPRTHAANKKVAFQKIGGSTKRPNPYLQRTEIPKLSLTTPATTLAPASTTVYHRTPGVSLVNAFPLTFTNMPFFDFIRSQILPRIGLSLISFMATSPLILTLMGVSAAGRRKRDLIGPADDHSMLGPLDLSKIFEENEEENGSKSVKKHGALYDSSIMDKDIFPPKDLPGFTSLVSKLFKSSNSKSSINKKKSSNTSKNKYIKTT